MRLFVVKSTTFSIIIIIITMNVKSAVSHVIYKKIHSGNDKIIKIYSAPNQVIKINTRYIPRPNNTKSTANKTSKYTIKENLNSTEPYEKYNSVYDVEKKYEMISTSNKYNITENRYFSDQSEQPQSSDKINIYGQTDLNVPLFLPYLFENETLSVDDINNYLNNNQNYLKRKPVKPFVFNLKNFSRNECEMKGDLINRIKDVKQKFNNSSEVSENGNTEFDPLAKLAKCKNSVLGLFTVVQFTNEICTDGSESSYGTCYHYVECNKLGGIAKGSCAQGHGVCCYVEQTCGKRTNANAAYFIGGTFFNTSEPGVYACSIIIDKADPRVKQIRLDFVDFQTAGPFDGNCQIDRFIVSGQNDNNILPEICGINDGQHMYIDIDAVPGPVMLAVLSSGAKGLPMKFRIHIQQLRESSAMLAPENCLQYFLPTNGVIKSFNYQNEISSDTASGYMNNLNYAICIKKQPGYCGISYSNSDSNLTEKIFELNNVDDEGMPTVPEGEAGAESYNCPDDYLVLNNMRLCGYRLNDASENSNLRDNHEIKVSDNGPFIIQLKTNTNITGRGFYLTYQQNLCIVN